MYRYQGRISADFLEKALSRFSDYKSGRSTIDLRVKEDIKLYRQEYSEFYNKDKQQVNPKTGYILSAVENKQADFTDNYPMPNILPREPSDEEASKTLTKIVPAILEMSGFKKTYKKHTRQKIKKGTGFYGVFWNGSEIVIEELDFFSVYSDPTVRDIQKSQFLFIVDYISNDMLRREYPEAAEVFSGDAQSAGYTLDSATRIMRDRSEIIDCYYKKADGSLHMMKLCKGQVIEASEDIPGYENGIYSHGKYPVIFDSMYPDDDSPYGFGAIDIARNPQLIIDRLDGTILKNSLRSGNPKTLISKASGINAEDFADSEKEIIEVANLNEDTYKTVSVDPLPGQVMNYRTQKIQEIKEILGNRDFQQGGTSNGVTAASAIQALQEAGDKLSRMQIDDTYDAYRELIIMVIELMREFYTEEKVYRITNEHGLPDYAVFSGDMLYTERTLRDSLGFAIGKEYERSEFDISVIPQRMNVYKRETNNQTIVQLMQLGLFNPQNIEMSLIVLSAMNFDGKDMIVEKLTELMQKTQMMQVQEPVSEGVPASFAEESYIEEQGGNII